MTKKKNSKKSSKKDKKQLHKIWLEAIGAIIIFMLVFGISLKNNFENKETDLKNKKLEIVEKDSEKESADLVLRVIQEKDNIIEINPDIISKIESDLDIEIAERNIYKNNLTEEEVVLAENKKLPIAILPKNISEKEFFIKLTPFIKQENNKWILNLEKIGQKRFYINQDFPTVPDSLPRKGKYGAATSAYVFINFENEREQKFIQDVLPKLEPYLEDGTLKIHWSPANPNKNNEVYRASMAAHCIQDYTDQFFWQFLKELGKENFPLEYNDLARANNTVQLNEYAFARCINNSTHNEALQNESSFAEKLNITTTPSFVIENQILIDTIDSEKIINTIREISHYENFEIKSDNKVEDKKYLTEPSLGRGNIRISLYSSADCESCRILEKTLLNIHEKNSEVKIIYRQFPKNKKAELVSIAEECAHSHNNFWSYHNWIITHPNEIKEEDLKNHASLLGVHPLSFKNCLDTKKYSAEVSQDKNEIERKGFNVQPVVCIETSCFEGTISEEKINSEIDKIKKASESNPALPM